MKTNKAITSALIALGLISAAGVANADSTVTIGGNSYNEVFFTGSTAARGNVFNAIDAASNGVFDSAPTLVPSGATGSTGNYTAYGAIGGVRYCICCSFTGSEAGLWAIEHNVNGIPNAIAAGTLGSNPAFPNAVIPGTPNPTGFVDPNSGNPFTAQADLAMADTSQAVSLSAPPAFAALTDYGCVGAVTFEWVKGNNTSPDSSWTDMVNITDPQANYLLSGPQHAYFITGNPADGDDVFAAGRNKASGTHQNTMLDTLHGTTVAVDQYVANSCTYSGSGVLTLGNTNSLVSQGGIDEVFNDGFDSGSSVAGTLTCDEANFNDGNTNGILVGYVGISDAKTAISFGARGLTLNGVAENDQTVENGNYSFWGHEHLYGTVSEDSAVQAVAHALVGTGAANHTFGSGSTLGGALERVGGLGGGEGNPATTQSSIIDPKFMAADKASDGDPGYAAPLH